jgi:hypothetical protein
VFAFVPDVGTSHRADDCSDMEPSTQYRTFAEECRRLAQSAKTVEERKVLQEMEAIWTKLAVEEGDGKNS